MCCLSFVFTHRAAAAPQAQAHHARSKRVRVRHHHEQTSTVSLAGYSHCSEHKNRKFLNKHEYERNSVTAILSKTRAAPLLSFTHSEDARALRVSADRVWILYAQACAE